MPDPVAYVRRRLTEFTDLRRALHAHPELAFEETKTSNLVAERLTSWGVDVHRGIAKTGIVGVIVGKRSGDRAIGLRADMDALPMHETAERAHKSQHEGRMHACGHDGHTTMLLAAARYLAETRDFAGKAYVIFQPAEEHGGGGNVMIQEGLFDRFPMDEVYALHNWPALALGKIAVRSGPVLAAADEWRIEIRGRGGHAAIPELVVDPVLVAAHLITALQSIASRNVSPLDAVVVSVCSMRTSQLGVFNVIPDGVDMVGTVRTFRAETQKLAQARLSEIAHGVASAFGATAVVHYMPGYPATVNSAREANFAAEVGEMVFGPTNVVRDFDPTMGAEDFSYMLQAKPGAYLLLGQGGSAGCHLHNPQYDFNDEVIPWGAGYLASLAETALRG